jgi:hypothetical protein
MTQRASLGSTFARLRGAHIGVGDPPKYIPSLMSSMGHEDAFPPPRLSGRCRFSQGTFAGTRGNGEDAPIPDLPDLIRNGELSTGHKDPFPGQG